MGEGSGETQRRGETKVVVVLRVRRRVGGSPMERGKIGWTGSEIKKKHYKTTQRKESRHLFFF